MTSHSNGCTALNRETNHTFLFHTKLLFSLFCLKSAAKATSSQCTVNYLCRVEPEIKEG